MSETTDQLEQKLLELRDKKRAAQAADKEAKRLAKEYVTFEREVLALMEERKVSSCKLDGNNFVSATTVYGNVQDRQAFIEWARENDESLIESKERKQLVSELVRERLDNGEPLPPGVGYHVKEYVSLRAA